MDKRNLPQTAEHKAKIGAANKGIHLNEHNGKLIVVNGKKLCPVCKEWKLLSEFDKRPERPIGVKPKCKPCAVAYRNSPGQIKSVKLAQYKSGAKKRGIDWRLSKDQFLSLWQKPCFYCGDLVPTIGIDRISSNEGYSIDNVISCCAICNTMKLALPRDVFIQHCHKIINHQKD
jgi:hypothetical protein